MTTQSWLAASLTVAGTWSKVRWLIIAAVVLVLATVVAAGRVRQRLIRRRRRSGR
ncbi:MAG: hypothetical protein LBJ44_01325 [Propionibacteriaceae bacterium]|nr:hypothetical protein [Propionibacteriaceae bacterium]